MKSINTLDEMISVIDEVLSVLDDWLMEKPSWLLSDAFDSIDEGLTTLCEARYKARNGK